jgi:hypothetical protein
MEISVTSIFANSSASEIYGFREMLHQSEGSAAANEWPLAPAVARLGEGEGPPAGTHQKQYLPTNWMMRGSPTAVVIVPNTVLWILACGAPQFTLLTSTRGREPSRGVAH